MIKARPLALVCVIALGALLRLAPHPPNVSPIAAMGLFGGAYLSQRWAAFAAPLAALFLSDLAIGFYPHMEVVYAALAFSVVLGGWVRANCSVLRVGLAASAGAVVFFAASNLSVFAFSGMYPHTLAGLEACFAAALPFFQNTLAGDLFYAALLFGGFALAERSAPALRAAPALPEAA